VLLTVTLFAVYLATISPDIQWLDSSQLQAAALLLDNAHPPGEPLYSVIAHAMRFVPIGSLAFRITVVSSICSILAMLSVYRLLLRLPVFTRAKTTWHLRLIGASLTLFLAFSYAAWSQSTRSEVYALNFLLSVIILNLCLSALTTSGSLTCRDIDVNRDPAGFLKSIYLVSFLLGLSAGNHSLLIALMAPAILMFLVFPNIGRLNITGLLVCALLFSLGLSIYLYLPVRASTAPPVNWGNPQSIERMIWMITGKMFQKSFHISMGQLFLNLKETVFILMAQLSPVIFFTGIFGLWLTVRRNIILGGFFICLLIFNLLSVICQEVFIGTNPDLLGYLLLSNLMIIVGVYWSLAEGLRILETRKTGFAAIAALAAVSLLAGLFLTGLYHTFTKVNQQDHYSANRFAKTVLSAADANSYLFTSNIATFFTAGYLQNVERYREDITLIHRPFLTFDWYVENLVEKHPHLDTVPPRHFNSIAAFSAYGRNQSIYVELGLGISEHLIPHLSPNGLIFKYHDKPVSLDEDLMRQQRSRMRSLDNIVGAGTHDVEAVKTIYWHHYCHGIFYAARQLYDQARWQFERCLAISSHDQDILALLKRLETEKQTGQKGNWNFRNKRILP
jgi:hypothetical protein